MSPINRRGARPSRSDRRAPKAEPRKRAARAAPAAPEPLPPLAAEGRHEWTLAWALLLAAWAVLLAPQLFQGKVFVLGDAGAYRPFARFSREEWRAHHRRTYWNPYTVLGMDAVATLSDSRPQYLPDVLLDAQDRVAEPPFAPQLWPILVQLLSAAAVMMLARRLWGAPGLAALTGALVWLYSIPILVPFVFGHDAQLVSDALLPVGALGTFLIVRGARPRAALAGRLLLAAALGLQILHGHPQITVYSTMFLVAFALQQALAARAPRRLIGVATALALGIAIGMAVWLPALVYSPLSFRGGGTTPGLSLAEVNKYSLGWRDLLSYVWPKAVGYGGSGYWGHMAGTDYSPYLGAVVAALAIVALRASGSGRGSARFFGLVIAVGIVLTLGTTLGPLFAVVRAVVPLWSKFRVPLYVLVVSVLAMALLVPRALVARGESPSEPPIAKGAGGNTRRLLIASGALVGLVGLGLALGPLDGFYASLAHALKPRLTDVAALGVARAAGLDLLFRLALVIAALAAWRAAAARGGAPPRTWTARLALPLVITLDLGSIVIPTAWHGTGSLDRLVHPPPTALAQVAARDPGSRAYVGVNTPMPGGYHEAYNNYWITWRARCFTGLAAFPLDRWRRVMEAELARSGPALRAWGVRYLDLPAPTRPDSAALMRVGERDGIDVYAFRRAVGRAYAVRYVLSVPDDEAAARAMATAGFDPAQAAVTTAPGATAEYPGSERCAIRWVRDDPDRQALTVSAPDRAFLVVADSQVPGWTARLDGKPAPILLTDVLVRGLEVPPGEHRIEMEYRTPGMAAGVLVTRVALGFWLALALAAIASLALRSPADSGVPASSKGLDA